jgi:pimeloyl-ACP methyl ester carboxylesterase
MTTDTPAARPRTRQDSPGYIVAAAGVLDNLWRPVRARRKRLAGGALAQRLALDHPARVRSLVLISTSPATSGDRALPWATEEFARLVTTKDADWSDAGAVAEYLVDYSRAPARAGHHSRLSLVPLALAPVRRLAAEIIVAHWSALESPRARRARQLPFDI